MSLADEMFLKDAIEAAIKENEDYMFLNMNAAVSIENGVVVIKDVFDYCVR